MVDREVPAAAHPHQRADHGADPAGCGRGVELPYRRRLEVERAEEREHAGGRDRGPQEQEREAESEHPLDVAHHGALLAGAEVVLLDPLQLGPLSGGEAPYRLRVGPGLAGALDEAEQVRLDEHEPLHHDRARARFRGRSTALIARMSQSCRRSAISWASSVTQSETRWRRYSSFRRRPSRSAAALALAAREGDARGLRAGTSTRRRSRRRPASNRASSSWNRRLTASASVDVRAPCPRRGARGRGPRTRPGRCRSPDPPTPRDLSTSGTSAPLFAADSVQPSLRSIAVRRLDYKGVTSSRSTSGRW